MCKKVQLRIFTLLVFITFSLDSGNTQSDPFLKNLEQEVLNSNLELRLASLNQKIAQNNYTRGNAGLLPEVSLNLNNTTTLTANQIKLADGRDIENDYVPNNNFFVNLSSDIVIYNGGRNKNMYERLRILTNSADKNKQIIQEEILYITRQLYYTAIRQKQLIQTTKSAAEFTEELLELATNKLDIGTGNKVIVLQARIDKNQLLAELQTQEQMLNNIYDQINFLRDKVPGTPVETAGSGFEILSFDKSELYNSIIEKNLQLQNAQINLGLAINAKQDADALSKPQIVGSLGYNFSRADNGGGFFLRNVGNGFAGGVGVMFPLFTGGRNHTMKMNADVGIDQARIEITNIQNQLISEFEQAYRNYNTAFNIALLQRENVESADENLNLSLKRFKVGVTDGFELKQIQQSSIEANFRYIDAQFQIKLNELELLKMSGKLLEQVG
jgi:outer membrane protein